MKASKKRPLKLKQPLATNTTNNQVTLISPIHKAAFWDTVWQDVPSPSKHVPPPMNATFQKNPVRVHSVKKIFNHVGEQNLHFWRLWTSGRGVLSWMQYQFSKILILIKFGGGRLPKKTNTIAQNWSQRGRTATYSVCIFLTFNSLDIDVRWNTCRSYGTAPFEWWSRKRHQNKGNATIG